MATGTKEAAGRENCLQKLPLILRYPGVVDARCRRMMTQQAVQDRSAAAVQTRKNRNL
jgi:hypothetical protein